MFEKVTKTIRNLYLALLVCLNMLSSHAQDLPEPSKPFRVMTTSAGLVVEQDREDTSQADSVVFRITETISGKLLWQGIPDT